MLLNVYTGDLDAGDLDGCWRGPWTPDPTPAARAVEADALSLTSRGRTRLPTGIYARWRRIQGYVDTPRSPRVSWNSTKPPAWAAGT